MGYFTDSLRALRTTWTNLLRRPTTVQFPAEKRVRAERYRSSFALLHDEQGDELCIGCLQCERICPSEVILIKAAGKKESPVTGKKRGYADDFVLDLNACIFCELCVQVCPTDAIVMTREPELPGYGREDLVLTMARLYANEKNMPRAWGDATKLMAMQENPDLAAKKHAAHAAKTAEAKPAPEAKPVDGAKPAEGASPSGSVSPAGTSQGGTAAPAAGNAGESAPPGAAASGGGGA